MTHQLDFFHNTIGLLPSEKLERESKALNQTEKVLKVFQANPDVEFTPPEVCMKLEGYPLLTSVRRAMSDLVKAGKLVKTNNRRTGSFGELNYTWRLA